METESREQRIERMHIDAWVGDAVLALWARQWLLERYGARMGEKMTLLTNNQFLSQFGNPTQEEALIGQKYKNDGLEAAFAYCTERYIARFLQQENNRQQARSARQRSK